MGISPVTGATGMNLNGWGPKDLDQIVCRWKGELRGRFGWRRLVNPGRLAIRWWQRRRLARADPNTASAPAQPAPASP